VSRDSDILIIDDTKINKFLDSDEINRDVAHADQAIDFLNKVLELLKNINSKRTEKEATIKSTTLYLSQSDGNFHSQDSQVSAITQLLESPSHMRLYERY